MTILPEHTQRTLYIQYTIACCTSFFGTFFRWVSVFVYHYHVIKSMWPNCRFFSLLRWVMPWKLITFAASADFVRWWIGQRWQMTAEPRFLVLLVVHYEYVVFILILMTQRCLINVTVIFWPSCCQMPINRTCNQFDAEYRHWEKFKKEIIQWTQFGQRN